MEKTLLVHEIYYSIQGEGAFAGRPCIFIRLTGCPLRCRYCDTAHAFQGGNTLSFDQILETISEYPIKRVEITGGEPLAQESTPELMRLLIHHGFQVMIETGGSEDVSVLPENTHIIMDLKTPGSGMVERNLYANIKLLKKSDEIKFVITSKDDFLWSLEQIDKFDLINKVQVLFSPAFGLVKPLELTEWFLEAKIDGKVQLQIHKYIWPPNKKGV